MTLEQTYYSQRQWLLHIRHVCGTRVCRGLCFSFVSDKACVHCWLSFSLDSIKKFYTKSSQKDDTRQSRESNLFWCLAVPCRMWTPWGQWSQFLHHYNPRIYKRPSFRAGSSTVELTCNFKCSPCELQFSSLYWTRTVIAVTTTEIYRWFFVGQALCLAPYTHFLI